MNLGKLIGELMFPREKNIARPSPEKSPAEPKKKKLERILELLRGQQLTLDELHAKIGGSRASLSVFLSNARDAGEVRVSGSNRLHLRYSAEERVK
ncbi:MAG: hypothetical protein M0Z99_32175 [Betaproteobacteria bacterium]|nr:hypothetical protein [Betaproteobacteria bacterium]